MTRTYVLDGHKIRSTVEFYDEFERTIIPNDTWGRNLDALNDVLRGGFGTPDDGFTIHWTSSGKSRSEMRRNGEPTAFDTIVEIISEHGNAGSERHSNVILILE